MEYHYYQKTGAYHIATGASCQDAFLNVEDSTYSLIALADGVSACKYGKAGAEKTIEALWDFIRTEGDNVFLHSPQKLTYLLLEHVLYYLELASLSKTADIKEFSSTLAFACIEKKTGRAVVGNLGDGRIIGFMENTVKQISVPTRYTNKPFVTTSKYANKAMVVQYYDLSLGDSILLGSDGFTHALLALDRRGFSISEVLENFEFCKLDKYLEEYPEADDCTYVAVKQARKKTERK